MILLESILHDAIGPALGMLPSKMDSRAARIMLLAIGLQESRFRYRYQKIAGKPYVKGPARGFWQFERAGGVVGVMTHAASHELAEELCQVRRVPFDSVVIHDTLERDDVLAAGFARLLLWTDRKALPSPAASHQEAWDCYIRNWRPGRPHRDSWDDFHDQAISQVT